MTWAVVGQHCPWRDSRAANALWVCSGTCTGRPLSAVEIRTQESACRVFSAALTRGNLAVHHHRADTAQVRGADALAVASVLESSSRWKSVALWSSPGCWCCPGGRRGRDSWRPVVLSLGRLGEGQAPAGLETFQQRPGPADVGVDSFTAEPALEQGLASAVAFRDVGTAIAFLAGVGGVLLGDLDPVALAQGLELAGHGGPAGAAQEPAQGPRQPASPGQARKSSFSTTTRAIVRSPPLPGCRIRFRHRLTSLVTNPRMSWASARPVPGSGRSPATGCAAGSARRPG
jgi:hypothetical protein